MIEDINKNDDAKLQNDFNVYEQCSEISKINFLFEIDDIKLKFLPCLHLGGPDECQVGADIYQCGRDIAPAATADIFTISKGTTTVVCFIYHFAYF
jgi:hypothetical protein